MTSVERKKIGYGILAGLMLTASFPPGKLEWLAWVALLPLLKSLDQESPSRAFKLGLVTGLAHYLTLVYWVVVVLKHYGGLPFVVSVSLLLLLCLYLALYPAIFSFLFSHLNGSTFAGLIAGCFWVSLEYIRAKILTGFPWALLGYTQFKQTMLIQIADQTGVYGISFLIVLVNTSLFFLFFPGASPRKRFLRWDVMVALVLVSLTLFYGKYRLSSERGHGEGRQTVKIAVIQGNIDQSVKWEPTYQEKTIDIYHRLTREARPFKPELIVWPETSVPFFFQDNLRLSPKVIRISEESGAHLIFGSPAYRRGPGGTKYYNRAYLLSPNGDLSGYYDKVHLVPFGEYVPLKRFLPFVQRLVPAAGDFASGEKVSPLHLPRLTAGILICFEVIFPELARKQAREGAQILVNLTNDAWFGMTSAPYQHLAMATFRAVENGKPMIRAANTGFSAFISPRGKIITRSDLFEEQVLQREVEIGSDPLRFYTRYGDLFALSLLIISLIKVFHVVCYNLIRGRRR